MFSDDGAASSSVPVPPNKMDDDPIDQKLSTDYTISFVNAIPAAVSMSMEEEEGTEEYDNSSKRPKLVSKVWDVFEKLPERPNEDTKALCKLCNKIYTAKATSGTSHLRRHIDSCIKRGNRNHNQPTVKHLTTNASFNVTSSSRLGIDQLRRAVATMVVLDQLEFNVVEDACFKTVMAAACPEFQAMTKEDIKNNIISIYVKERESIRDLLTTCPGRICLTSHIWKSTTDDFYNCVTAHFIDHDWKLQKRTLRFKRLLPPYDSLSIGDDIALCMVEWNIEPKVLSITLDDVSSDDCAISLLKSRLEAKKYLHDNGAFFHVGCFGHMLNFIVQAGFDMVNQIIGKIRLGIRYVKQSPHRRRNFYIIAKSLNVDTSKKLCLDCPTMWNSTFHMIEIAIRYKVAFRYLSEQDKNFTFDLSDDEWEKVTTLHRFLKVFYEVTCMFSGTRYPTSNLYFKGLWKIHSHLSNTMRGPENFMTGVVREMQSKLSKYWSKYSLVLACAAILDPRYKIKFVEYCYAKLYSSGAQQYVDIIVNTLYGLFSEYTNNSAKSSANSGTVVQSPVPRNKGEDDEFKDYETFRSSRFSTRVEKSQLDLYLDEPSHDLNSEVNVLEFWSSCSVRYPELSRMARDVLTIPVSMIDYESTFFLGARVISPYHSSLKSKTVRALICLRDWLQAYDRTRKPGCMESNLRDDSSSSSSDDDDY